MSPRLPSAMTSRPPVAHRRTSSSAHAVGPQRLEERELRLDGHGVGRDRVDDPVAEADERVRRVIPPLVGIQRLDGREVALRVEPDDELGSLTVDRLGEPVAERRRLDAFRRFGSTPSRSQPTQSLGTDEGRALRGPREKPSSEGGWNPPPPVSAAVSAAGAAGLDSRLQLATGGELRNGRWGSAPSGRDCAG